MGAFFNSWALWEKMCFVLACAIFGVIILGCGKVVYNHWRLRKYTKIAAVKAQNRQAIEQRPSVRARKGREVPFGIRAIESGVEVDGVWISRSNTPNASATGSPAPSIMLEHDPAKHAQYPERTPMASSQHSLEVPRPIHGHPAYNQSRSSTASRNSGALQDQYNEHERLPRSSTASDNVPRARPTYQPRRSSGLRYSNSHDTTSALAALEGRRMAPTPENAESQDYLYGQRSPRSSGSNSGSSNSSEEHEIPRRPRMARDSSDILFDPTYLPSGGPRTPNAEYLDALASHRRSHAAEVGQLPRVRLSNMNGGSNSDTPLEHRYMFDDNHSSGHTGNPFATPVATPTGSTGNPYMEEPPSFASFVNSSSYPNDHNDMSDDGEAIPYDRQDNNVLQQGDGNRQDRQSQAVRKVNSGFEILRPGSFSQPRYVADWNEKTGIEAEQQPETGVDAHRNKRHSKKLQRKRADSKESRFKEEV